MAESNGGAENPAAGGRVRRHGTGRISFVLRLSRDHNLMQPDIANRLRDRKADNISRTRPEVIATGNIGCMMQLQDAVDAPVVHTVELLDWATGGPAPADLDGG